MKNYSDLEIYKLSYDLALKVHRLSLKLPKHELYEEGGQLRRSSKGIPACIVEGYGRGKYKAELNRFLVYAQASCDETILHLSFLKDLYSEVADEAKHYMDSYRELGGKINRFIQFVGKKWNKGLE